MLKIEDGVDGYQLILMQKSSVHTFTVINALGHDEDGDEEDDSTISRRTAEPP